MTKKILIWLGVFAVTGLILWGLIYLQQRSTVPAEKNIEVSVIKDTDWIKGDRASKVVLVEYGDFQCPGCRDYEPLVQEVIRDLGSQFVFVYRHFPLPQHKQAPIAGQAAEAAGMQGKFWEMHDMLYEKQNEWSLKSDADKKFVEYAKILGLDEKKFTADYNSNAAKERVESDLAEGQRYRVSSTPTFFLNGTIIKINSIEHFKQLIKDAAGS